METDEKILQSRHSTQQTVTHFGLHASLRMCENGEKYLVEG